MCAARQKSNAVRGTNDSSTLSKCSMMQHGYFPDNYLKYFAAKTVRRAPLIHRGYYIRTKVIDWVLQRFLYYFNDVIPQVVSLGAGYDSSCFRLLSEGARGLFVEIDYPQTVISKCAIIKSTPNLLELLQGPIIDLTNKISPLKSKQYHLLGVDLCDVTLLEKVLLAIINPSLPTLFLSECVMTYMSVTDSQKLIKWSSDKFINALFVTYEQIHPADGFGLVMQEHFRSLGSPLKAINTFPTLRSQEERYLQAGYEAAVARDMNCVYHGMLDASEQCRIENLEVFDEFPEWHLKCAHYTLILACKGNCCPLQQQLMNVVPNLPIIINGGCQGKTFKLTKVAMESGDLSLSRYGHSSVMISDDVILLIGGYGRSEQGKHSRLNNCLAAYCTNDGQWRTSSSVVTKDNFPPLIYLTATRTSTGSVIIFGGRQSPKHASNTCYQLSSCGDCEKWRLHVADTKGCLPQPRYKHSAVNTWTMDGLEVIVVFGGRSDNGEALGSCCVLEVNSLTWREAIIDGEAPTARFSHSSFAWKDNIFIVGGLGSDSTPVNSMYKVTIQSSNRITSEKIELPSFPSQYSSAVICHDDDIAYLIGGVRCHGDGTAGVTALHLPSMTWSHCDIEIAPDCRPVILANHTAHFWRESIIIFGGGGNCFSFGTHYNSVYSLKFT